MATMAGERLFCDTNVLLSAVDKKRALHRQALHVLDALPNQGVELCLNGQVIREFLVVSTRPIEVNGLGLTPQEAVGNADAIVDRCTILEENRDVAARLRQLVRAAGCAGKQIHDANIVATMQAHGVTHMLTDNLADFRRFSGLDVVDLARLSLDGGG